MKTNSDKNKLNLRGQVDVRTARTRGAKLRSFIGFPYLKSQKEVVFCVYSSLSILNSHFSIPKHPSQPKSRPRNSHNIHNNSNNIQTLNLRGQVDFRTAGTRGANATNRSGGGEIKKLRENVFNFHRTHSLRLSRNHDKR